MSARRTSVLGAMVLLCWYGAEARAGTLMGTPIATLEEQQWAVGLGYGFGEADWEASGLRVQIPSGASPTYTAEFIDLDGLATHVALASLAYGICDNWDAFIQFGVSDAQDRISIQAPPPGGAPEYVSYDGDYGLAFGLGTRATFCHWGPWRFGGLAQVTWFDPKDSDFISSDPDVADTVFVGRADIDFWQAQFALTAAYQIDTLTFWAGPFLQFVEGDLQRRGRTLLGGTDSGSFQSSADIENDGQAGVHVGINWEVSTKLDGQIESQFTRDSWFLAFGAVVKPRELLARP
ncbi:MAG: hypothetical protein JSW27_07255 [Phycisphaerales bacterium]|nr:MAG: hypothetical protein JSW27_07255 [Phycisphaerales bacterium]